jgi:hypothetical protein
LAAPGVAGIGSGISPGGSFNAGAVPFFFAVAEVSDEMLIFQLHAVLAFDAQEIGGADGDEWLQ